MYKEITINTEVSECLINITEEVRNAVRESKVNEGICVIFVPHTTAGITINSGMDEKTFDDIVSETHRLVPTRVDFHHTYDTPTDAAGHVKSVLVGNSLTLIVKDGELILGHSQSVLFFEFDGPRKRRALIRVMNEEEK
jgi:secondary thiamine-phosphate synthase enzyme